MQTTEMIKNLLQIHQPNLNLFCIAWNQQQESSVFMGIQIKQSFNQNDAISSLNKKPLKLVDQFIYFGSNISSTESDVNRHISKVYTGGVLMV